MSVSTLYYDLTTPLLNLNKSFLSLNHAAVRTKCTACSKSNPSRPSTWTAPSPVTAVPLGPCHPICVRSMEASVTANQEWPEGPVIAVNSSFMGSHRLGVKVCCFQILKNTINFVRIHCKNYRFHGLTWQGCQGMLCMGFVKILFSQGTLIELVVFGRI